jgi:TonB family protein
MGYQALLFCPDEKTARTVTQVLSELEFAVEPCTEPFAAVKKLMGEHFDAVVVDCENEQNATLLFKSARNSTSNQASLAVAVVEGQAGVAKAFRIGANLVLTKPINVEQAKGTLRVARGLLRKGDSGKPAASAGTAATPAKGAGATANPVAPASAAKPAASLGARPGQRVAAAASSTPVARGEVGGEIKAATSTPVMAEVKSPVVQTHFKPANASPPMFQSGPAIEAENPPVQPISNASALPSGVAPSETSMSFSSGAASAPAPARSTPGTDVTQAVQSDSAKVADALFEKPAKVGEDDSHDSAAATPAPSFTFGGANAPEESTGSGSKKVLLGVAAAVIVATGLYVGLTQFHGKVSVPVASSQQTTPAPALTTSPSTAAKPAKPPAPAASSVPAPATSIPTASIPTTPQTAEPSESGDADTTAESAQPTPSPKTSAASAAKGSAKSTSPASSTAATPASDNKPAAQPIVVKNGASAGAQTRAAAPDAPAPNVIGIAPSSSGGALSNLLPNQGTAPKPILQTLNVSQGVSQGLLIKKVQPAYPPNALRMRLEGAVQIQATIGKSGNIAAVKVLSGEPLLAKAAVDAVKQWKYKPYYLNGEPVEIQTQITVNFKLPN